MNRGILQTACPFKPGDTVEFTEHAKRFFPTEPWERITGVVTQVCLDAVYVKKPGHQKAMAYHFLFWQKVKP